MAGTKPGHDEPCYRAPFQSLLFESGSQDDVSPHVPRGFTRRVGAALAGSSGHGCRG
jgi:hypothetical protein